jgi:hypothetical protein
LGGGHAPNGHQTTRYDIYNHHPGISAAERTPGIGVFWGPILGFFGQLQGIFHAAGGDFFGFLANYTAFLGALARSIAPTANFSPEKKRTKTNESKKFYRFSMQLQRKQGHFQLGIRHILHSASLFTQQDLFNRIIFMD